MSPTQKGSENQSSQASEYINIEAEENLDETNDQDVNKGHGEEDDGENHAEEDDGEDHAEDNEGSQKAKRQKTLLVWEDFVEVTLPSGEVKVECVHCKKKWLNTQVDLQQLTNDTRKYPVDVDMKPPSLIGLDGKYDVIKMRESIANWLMATEQPFNTVEDDMFVYMMKTANPMFERVSRATIKSDCIKVYERERKKLKALINDVSSICLTTNCWKSSHQRIEYMVITGHFIDQNWRLQKRVLSFVHVPPPRIGLDIADGIYKCLKECEVEGKIFSISVDNASYNDRAVSTFKKNFSKVKKLTCGGRLFHVRCCAHILNLLVKDGLSRIEDVIEEVREAVKYINHSEARRQSFSNVAHQLQVPDRKLLIDVTTRWNSTYDTLSLAIKFKDVFPRYADYEPHFKHLPTEQDWENVERVCEVLQVFKVCTNVISGSDYPTANLYLIEVYKVKETLDKGVLSESSFIRDMTNKRKEKFDKYWGECHLLMAIAGVLDPRLKKRVVNFCYEKIYSSDEASKNIEDVSKALELMYEEYLENHDALMKENASNKSGSSRGNGSSKANEESIGSGWDAFDEYLKDADFDRPGNGNRAEPS
ncbi:zinc finger BED domain-containing protein RICESLEEPER 2-like [Helianthus annuus]|uniref:zinc finger BED domain-containing protein RICESLEEPER 2-like n=1 Tax=Helianthus annuus TaxID=4232 RepID=UPI001653003A|nr:zinc finger BED domain-containing protein RICESLEEPER 2-like [Helianthus annuus]